MVSDLIIPEPLASKIRDLASAEKRAPAEVLERMMVVYQAQAVPFDDPPRPSSSLRDEDIEVPDDVQDAAAYRESVRALRPKLYEKAREYWQKMDDQERLRLSDEELDRLCWLIDADGIPRFKTEKAGVTLPPDPLDELIGLVDSGETDLSTRINETVRHYRKKRHGALRRHGLKPPVPKIKPLRG